MPGPRVVAGVMSGTSADGMDVALVEVGTRWRWKLAGYWHRAYAPAERHALLGLAAGGGTPAEAVRWHARLGQEIGHAVAAACRELDFPLRRLAAVASHGQTIYHEGRVASLQIGDPARIAAVTGVPVISDFRAADIAAGGEGAPLVPWADRILFASPGVYRVALNLGGISNLTLLAPRGKTIAFDTGPGNMACDALMSSLSGGRQGVDRNGKLAAQGRVDEAVLTELLRHPYFRRRPPKSCGREQFGAAFVDEIRRRHPEVGGADLMATLVELTARTVTKGIALGGKAALAADVIVAGGGSKNSAMMRALATNAPGCRWRRSEEFGVPSQAREAMAFALLGEAHLRGVPANLPSATGAARAVVLGSYTPALSLAIRRRIR